MAESFGGRLRSVLITLIFLVSPCCALPNNPIIFVAQVPLPNDFATVNSTFGNQSGSIDQRSFGDLYIRYPDGTLKNLTAAAGMGNSGMQGANSIAVRDPAVHWSGTKVIFSMVVGAATQRYQINTYRWQLYEITNLGLNQTPQVTKVANQPAGFNNIMPTYASDGETIIFVSDRPRNGAAHLFPQRDEYESVPTNTGIWSLKPTSGELALLDHAPSGDFNPIIDSFGRVIFTRWDHLQRDQQADNESGVTKEYQAFNFSDESESAQRLNSIEEYFPEHEDTEAQAEADPSTNEHRFNQFFPWAMNQDGTNLETVNHIGRHELSGYIPRSFKNDPSLDDYYGQYSRTNTNRIDNFHFIKEDPTHPGRYFGIDCPEFGTHASGQIVSFDAAPNIHPSDIVVQYITARVTSSTSDNPPAQHSGLYRNPLPLSDGSLIAAHTSATQADSNIGTTNSPQSRYSYRLKSITDGPNGSRIAGSTLTSGISKNIQYWSPDELISYSGELWELQPVELVAKSAPAASQNSLESPELSILQSSGTSEAALKAYLSANDLALIISRNVTTRDSMDIQQPFNLKIENGVQTVGNNGQLYTVKFLQLFQGDQIRGYGSSSSNGRRVLAVPMHDGLSFNPTDPTGPTANVKLAADGSFSALVPARRALSWQLTDAQGKPVVRERYWVTFQPGEIRVCSSCHGLSSHDQAGHETPTNPPQALADIIRYIGNLPNPPPVASPTPGGGDSGLTIKISKAKRQRGSAVFRVSLRATTGGSGQSVSLRTSLDSLECRTLKRRVKLDRKGSKVLNMSIPINGAAVSGLITASRSSTSGTTSQTFSVPKGPGRANGNVSRMRCRNSSLR